jgi:hypothetical protein
MEQGMYWPDLANNVNDDLKKAVYVQTKCGSNRTGAIAIVADWLGVSPQIVKMRINDEIVGEPRSKGLLAAKCWEFLAMVAQRERAWVETLAAEVEQNRMRLQTDLNFEDRKPGDSSNRNVDARRVFRDEADVAAARRALDEFENVRARKAPAGK